MRASVLLAVVAIAVVMLLPSAFAQSIDKPSSTLGRLTSASASTPYVTGATAAAEQSSLTLTSPGELNIFAEANGGHRGTTQFASGGLVSTWDQNGHIAAAIAATQLDSNDYTTTDHYYSIAGVGVSGFLYYGEKTQKVTPPIEPTTTLTNSFVLKESALVVVVAASGGQDTIVLSGISGLVPDVNGTGGTWSGVMIGQAQLTTGTYTVTMTSTNHDAGGTNRADALGLFAFSKSRAGFISKQVATRVVATCGAGSGNAIPGYDPSNHDMYVPISGNITVLDQTCHIVGTITLPRGAEPYDAAYDPVNHLMYVTNDPVNEVITKGAAGSVYVIRGLQVEHVITTDMVYPGQLVWDPAASMMMVANQGYGIMSDLTGWVDGIQGTNVVIRIGTAPLTEGICYDPYADTVVSLSTGWYIGDIINASSLIDLGEVYIGNITGPGSGPLSCAYDPVDHYVYVSIWSGNSVLLLDGNNGTTLGNVSVGSIYESDIAWDPVSQTIWVGVDEQSGNWSLAIISGLSLAQTISFGGYPYGVAYDMEDHYMYVTTNTAEGAVYVVS